MKSIICFSVINKKRDTAAPPFKFHILLLLYYKTVTFGNTTVKNFNEINSGARAIDNNTRMNNTRVNIDY